MYKLVFYSIGEEFEKIIIDRILEWIYKRKMDNLDFIKSKYLCLLKVIFKKMSRKVIFWEKIYV